MKGVDDKRLRLCLDIGHVNAYSKTSVMDWLEICAPCISHFHIHNNDGTKDQHNALQDGTIPMKEFLMRADRLCPNASRTLEVLSGSPSARWLMEEVYGSI